MTVRTETLTLCTMVDYLFNGVDSVRYQLPRYLQCNSQKEIFLFKKWFVSSEK